MPLWLFLHAGSLLLFSPHNHGYDNQIKIKNKLVSGDMNPF